MINITFCARGQNVLTQGIVKTLNLIPKSLWIHMHKQDVLAHVQGQGNCSDITGSFRSYKL